MSEFGWVATYTGCWHKAIAAFRLSRWGVRFARTVCGVRAVYGYDRYCTHRPPDEQICKRCLAAEQKEREGKCN